MLLNLSLAPRCFGAVALSLVIALVLGLTAVPERKLGEVGENLVASAVSPDGNLVAGLQSAGEARWSLTVWQTGDAQIRLGPVAVDHPPASSRPLAFSADGSLLAVGGGDRIEVFDLAKGRSLRRLTAERWVREVRFSGSTLMARTDGSVFLWDGASGRLTWQLKVAHLLMARLAPGGGVLATAAFQDVICLWAVPSRKSLGTLEAGPATSGLEFCNQDRDLVAGFRFSHERQRDCLVVYEVATRRARTELLVHPQMMAFAVSQDGRRILSRSEACTRIWDGSGRLIHQRDVSAPLPDSLSPDGSLVCSLPSEGRQATVWEADSGALRTLLPGQATPVWSDFLGSGRLAIRGGSCSVWELR